MQFRVRYENPTDEDQAYDKLKFEDGDSESEPRLVVSYTLDTSNDMGCGL